MGSISNKGFIFTRYANYFRDLEQVKEIEPDLSATAECVALFLQCQLNIDKVFITHDNPMSIFLYFVDLYLAMI